MKVKLVYGAPCSGKTTYAKDNAADKDLIWDYDQLLIACSNRSLQLAESHPMTNFVYEMREKMLESAKDKSNVDNFFITCLWISDKIKTITKGFDIEEIFIDSTKEECLDHLENDDMRPDKEKWKMLINKWFNEHGNHSKEVKKDNMAMQNKKFWNWVKNENSGLNVLRLDGVIAEQSWLDDEVAPKQFRDDLNACDGDIEVYINSPGGDVCAASQIYTMLMEYKGNVTVKIDGLAASAASVIAMAGTTVTMAPTAMMMIHNPWTMQIGDEDEMRECAEYLAEFKESIINAYELKTGLSREKISELMTAETWMNAKKAVELGFADKILFIDNDGEDEEIQATMFSPLTVQNSLINKIKKKKFAGKKTANKNLAVTQNNRVDATQLYKRLNLISH